MEQIQSFIHWICSIMTSPQPHFHHHAARTSKRRLKRDASALQLRFLMPAHTANRIAPASLTCASSLCWQAEYKPDAQARETAPRNIASVQRKSR